MNYDLYLKTAVEAGKAILEIYNNKGYTIEEKEDKSPLTSADLKSNEIISNNLLKTGFPILSEENKTVSYEKRKKWKTYILVDPLDGTKEFVNRNGEFTVNIAIIKDYLPVFGVIYAPVPDILYWGSADRGSWKIESAADVVKMDLLSTGIAKRLPEKKIISKGKIKRVVASKSHYSKETEAFINEIKKPSTQIELVSKGSSLKFCLVAEGSADIYPRMGPTMEWDTGAGHAIAKFAGCKVWNLDNNEELKYNKENLLNPWFVVERTPDKL